MTPRTRTIAVDLALTIGLFAVLGVAGAFVWRAVVTLPTYVRTSSGGEMDQVQLEKVIGVDGWFFVIAAAAGLVAGAAVVLVRRHSDPLVLVVLLAIAGGVATYLMLQVGVHIGPGDPKHTLPAAAMGSHVPVQLAPKAHSVAVTWPFATVLGALLVLLVHSPRPRVTTDGAPTSGPDDGSASVG